METRQSVGHLPSKHKGGSYSGFNIEDNYFTQPINRENWACGLPSYMCTDIPDQIPMLVAVGGGKGGVGKSFVSANVGCRLAAMGFKVLVIDLDLGGANLHTYFGMSSPHPSLSNFILTRDQPFENIIHSTPISKLHMISAGPDENWSDQSSFEETSFAEFWDKVLNARKDLGFDFVIFDLGAGTQRYTVDLFSSAHMGIITSLAEPTSIENAYAFLKSMMWRIVDNSALHLNDCYALEELKQFFFDENNKRLKLSYLEKIKLALEGNPDLIHHIEKAISGRKVGFVINQIRSQKDIEVSTSMSTIVKNYFGLQTASLGFLNYDDSTWKALRNRRILLKDFPHAIVARRIGEITNNVLSLFQGAKKP